MRERLTPGDIPFRKAYLSGIIPRVEVGKEQIRILRRTEVVQQDCLGAPGVKPGIRSFVRKWRPVGRVTICELSRG